MGGGNPVTSVIIVASQGLEEAGVRNQSRLLNPPKWEA